MTPFNLPRPGENAEDMAERQEELIRFTIDKHRWPRARAIKFLEELDTIGLAYIGVEMKQARAEQAREAQAYDPFSSAFKVI
jgi:hypothetical protein